MNESRVGGACGPPPPFAAPLVPRCALTSGATPRDVLAAAYGSAGPERWMVGVARERVLANVYKLARRHGPRFSDSL
jgi:hypothetical protein